MTINSTRKMRSPDFHDIENSGSPCGAVARRYLVGFLAMLLLPLTTQGTILTTAERAELAHNSYLNSRREVLTTRENPYIGPAVAQVVEELPERWEAPRSPWHYQIRATIFWVGEKPTARNPVPNVASSWDPNWEANYGGYDHPFKRNGYFPAGFAPNLNPFYVALPYNDILKGREHRSEAPEVIPWFWRSYRGSGVSVCENRWVAIHHKGRIAYAQWKDVGPFTIDDWPYVFKGERPRPNTNQNAGIDISPAIRDYLGLRGNSDIDWRFVEDLEVPNGPWATWSRPAAGIQAEVRGP